MKKILVKVGEQGLFHASHGAPPENQFSACLNQLRSNGADEIRQKWIKPIFFHSCSCQGIILCWEIIGLLYNELIFQTFGSSMIQIKYPRDLLQPTLIHVSISFQILPILLYVLFPVNTMVRNDLGHWPSNILYKGFTKWDSQLVSHQRNGSVSISSYPRIESCNVINVIIFIHFINT